MKILILQDDFPPYSFGGAGWSTFYLAKGLQKLGHEVFVITTCQKRLDEANFDYQELKVFRIFANFHRRWQAYLSLYNPQTVKKVKAIIEEVNPDVVHANNIHGFISYHCLKIAKNFGKPVFLTARDTMEFSYGKLATPKYLEKLDCHLSWLDHLRQSQKRYNPLRNFFIKRYLKYVDKIFTISDALKKALSANSINNVEVNHTGIDVKDWEISQNAVDDFKKKYNLEGKKIIFFGGRISVLKGQEQIDQAMEKIKKDIPEAFLLIAGNGGIGWLQREEIKAAYHASEIVIVPSIYFDPFPRSNLEAMACAKPVVATYFGGSPEIVQDGITGYIVNPFDVKLLSEKIIDLLKDAKKAREFGAAGFKRVEKYFNLEDHIAKTIAWYKKLL